MSISEIRRQNLRDLMEKHSAIALAKMLGYRQSSFLSQMAGPNPTREITEKTARAYEKQLGMEPGTLDIPPVAAGPAAPALALVTAATPAAATDEPKALTTAETIALVLNATRTVGRICETEHVNLPTSKFADLLVMGLVDAMEHGGVMQEDRIKQVVALLK